ncbi:hypothetical protein B0A54_07004 [Friedmanniomyces endolithicus]|uniref:Cytochrome P450 n=1 Tax=Friedmanniomyces endolithicus TaxID=329885 RepID=A0A4U0V2D2_9PEZI|nr:hypothetical protein B0A54_07004 [Friedmanniomyces endolithicus]
MSTPKCPSPLSKIWQRPMVFSLTLFGKKRIFISSQKLMEEICDEKRFGKLVSAALGELRNGIHDGLFTAQNDEENWGLAHRILVPAFGPLNITGMFDDMKDVQLILQWRAAFMAPFYRADDAQFFSDIEYMRTLSQEIIDKRIQHPEDTKDLLNAMLYGKDPRTGKSLSQGTIIDNLITFLIAGHET